MEFNGLLAIATAYFVGALRTHSTTVRSVVIVKLIHRQMIRQRQARKGRSLNTERSLEVTKRSSNLHLCLELRLN